MKRYTLTTELLKPIILKQTFILPASKSEEMEKDVIFLPDIGVLIFTDYTKNKNTFRRQVMFSCFSEAIINFNQAMVEIIELDFTDPHTKETKKRLCLAIQIAPPNLNMLEKNPNLKYLYVSKDKITQSNLPKGKLIRLDELLQDLESSDSQKKATADAVLKSIDKETLVELILLLLILGMQVLPKEVILVLTANGKIYFPFIIDQSMEFTHQYFERKSEKNNPPELKLFNILLLLCIMMQQELIITKKIINKFKQTWNSEEKLLAWFNKTTRDFYKNNYLACMEDLTYLKSVYSHLTLIFDLLTKVKATKRKPTEQFIEYSMFELVKIINPIFFEIYWLALQKNDCQPLKTINHLIEHNCSKFSPSEQSSIIDAGTSIEGEESSDSEDEIPDTSNKIDFVCNKFTLLTKQHKLIKTIIEQLNANDTKLFNQVKNDLTLKNREKIIRAIDWNKIDAKLAAQLFQYIETFPLSSLTFKNSLQLNLIQLNKVLKKSKKLKLVACNNDNLIIDIDSVATTVPTLTKLILSYRIKVSTRKSSCPKNHTTSPSKSPFFSSPKISSSFLTRKISKKQEPTASKLKSLTIIDCVFISADTIDLSNLINLSELKIINCANLFNIVFPKNIPLTTLVLDNNPSLDITSILTSISPDKITQFEINNVFIQAPKEFQPFIHLLRNILDNTEIKISNIFKGKLDLSGTDITNTDLSRFQIEWFGTHLDELNLTGCNLITPGGLFTFLSQYHTKLSEIIFSDTQIKMDISEYISSTLKEKTDMKFIKLRVENDLLTLIVVTDNTYSKGSDRRMVYEFVFRKSGNEWKYIKNTVKNLPPADITKLQQMQDLVISNGFAFSLLYSEHKLYVFIQSLKANTNIPLDLKNLKLITQLKTSFDDAALKFTIYWKFNPEKNITPFELEEFKTKILSSFKRMKLVFYADDLERFKFCPGGNDYETIKFSNKDDYEMFKNFINTICPEQSSPDNSLVDTKSKKSTSNEQPDEKPTISLLATRK